MQRWNVIQHELIPELRHEVSMMTPKLEQVIHTLDWVRIEDFVTSSWCGIGRPPSERAWLANAFVAKAVLSLSTTKALIERLTIDRALRRICGFPMCKKVPSEATFSRAFAEFAEHRLPERVHEALIQTHLGDELIGHISRDGTAIPARERPTRTKPPKSAAKGNSGDVRRGVKRVRRPSTRRLNGNASRSCLRCWPRYRRPVIAAPSAMRKATKSVGTATSFISTRPIVASLSRPCSRRPRCTTAGRRFRSP